METTVRVLLAGLRTAASNSGRFFSSAAGSPVYNRALKVQRPTTIPYQETLHNFVSIIGVVEYPLRECKTANGRFGLHTCLRVTGGAYTYLSVLLIFWDEIAGMSVQHLKLHDLVYVSGHLASYMKVDGKGKHMHRYEFPLKISCRGAETDFTCGKYFSATHTSGGTIGTVNCTHPLLTSSTRIQVRSSGSKTMILHGSENNSNCMTQEQVNQVVETT